MNVISWRQFGSFFPFSMPYFFPACRFLLSLSAHTFMMWAYARQNSNLCTSHGELEVIKISFALNLCIFLSRPTTKRPKACHRAPLYLFFSMEAIKRVIREGASQCEGHEAHPMNRARSSKNGPRQSAHMPEPEEMPAPG